LEGGNRGQEITLILPVESSLDAEDVLSGPDPRFEVPEFKPLLLPDLAPRSFLVRLRGLEPSSWSDPPRLSTVLELRQQHPAGLVERHNAGGVTNGRSLPGSHAPSLQNRPPGLETRIVADEPSDDGRAANPGHGNGTTCGTLYCERTLTIFGR
jgi:hypothetical protein